MAAPTRPRIPRALLASSFVAAAVACARQREWESPSSGPRARLAFASSEGARCALQGRTKLDTEIHREATEYEPIAEVFQGEVGVEVLALAPRGSSRSKVRVRSVASGPALVIEGWVENKELELRLRHAVDVSPGHVWFERDAIVRALAGNGTRVRVGGEARCRSDFGVAVDVDCSALAIHEPSPDPPKSTELAVRPEPLVAKSWPLALLDDAGRRVFDLDYGEIRVARAAGLLTHVHIEKSGLNIRGWVESSSLEPPPDRSFHCPEIRDIVDLCPDTVDVPLPSPDDSDGCRERDWETRQAVREIPLRLEPKFEARVVGWVEPGAGIRVPRSGTRFVTVDAKPGALGGPRGAPFWALASDVR